MLKYDMKCRNRFIVVVEPSNHVTFKTRPKVCDFCRSLGCVFSRSYVPVKDWKCYPIDFENAL